MILKLKNKVTCHHFEDKWKISEAVTSALDSFCFGGLQLGMGNSEYRIQRIRIPNYPNPNCSFKLNNRIRFISCLQALSRCLVTDFLLYKCQLHAVFPLRF